MPIDVNRQVTKKAALLVFLKKESGFATDAGSSTEQASSLFREEAFGC
jgi:hypothetical protein